MPYSQFLLSPIEFAENYISELYLFQKGQRHHKIAIYTFDVMHILSLDNSGIVKDLKVTSKTNLFNMLNLPEKVYVSFIFVNGSNQLTMIFSSGKYCSFDISKDKGMDTPNNIGFLKIYYKEVSYVYDKKNEHLIAIYKTSLEIQIFSCSNKVLEEIAHFDSI